jgi:hypothetical protein
MVVRRKVKRKETEIGTGIKPRIVKREYAYAPMSYGWQ